MSENPHIKSEARAILRNKAKGPQPLRQRRKQAAFLLFWLFLDKKEDK